MKIAGFDWAEVRAKLSAAVLVMASLLAAGHRAQAQLVTVGDGGPGPVKAEHLTVEMTALSPQVAAGGTAQLGLVMTIEEHWHVYWKNAGDSGEPPTIKWTLPTGLTAGPLQFPPPSRLPLGPLMDFGYEDSVAFPITLTASPSTKPGKVHLDAGVSWLVCSSQCFPGKAHLGIDVEVVKGAVADPPLVGALGEAIKNLPKPLPAGMSVSAVADAKQILVTLKTGSNEEDAELYPFDQDVIANAAEQEIESLPDGITVRLDRAADPEHPGKFLPLPKALHALVELSSTEAYDLEAPITPGVLPAEAATGKKLSNAGQTTEVTVFTAVLLALLGGMLLNLMPCVFPVLFLKGLALVHSSGEEKARQRAHGLMYTVGILVSFWALVAVLLVLRAGGQQLGWGFQLQSPGFVAVLASLVFFLGLSLAGQFELGLSLTSAGGGLAQKQGLTGSFFTGVLATVVATPCMGPLMGTAVGFALAQPAWATFLVFTAVALGLALPYLVLTIQPQWTKLLPKPGAWMEVLKQLTAVPLFGTAIWLVWVFGQLAGGQEAAAGAGIDRMAWLLSGFLVLAIAGWALGRWPAQWKGAIVALVLIALAIYLPLRKPAAETMMWKPYTQASFEAARATGDPVFIDFTAAWCLSCKYNEGAVLKSAEVEKQFTEKHFQLLKADWTQYDPVITQQLAAVGRSGVPTYVIYPPGKVSNADVLPELLTKDIVLTAIKKDAKPMGTE